MSDYILKKALVSEKSFSNAAEGKFTFVVQKNADKASVMAAVKDLFKVNPLTVNIINIKGKVKRSKKGQGQRSDIKKAIVTLKKGEKIDLFEIEKEEKGQKAKPENKKIEENKDTTVKVRDKSKKQ